MSHVHGLTKPVHQEKERAELMKKSEVDLHTILTRLVDEEVESFGKVCVCLCVVQTLFSYQSSSTFERHD